MIGSVFPNLGLSIFKKCTYLYQSHFPDKHNLPRRARDAEHFSRGLVRSQCTATEPVAFRLPSEKASHYLQHHTHAKEKPFTRTLRK